MAYDEAMADRVREQLDSDQAWSERAMFGGLAFLLEGNMAVAIGEQGSMMARVTREQFSALADRDGVVPMQMGERTSNTFLRVDAEVLTDDAAFAEWFGYGAAVARSLPPK